MPLKAQQKLQHFGQDIKVKNNVSHEEDTQMLLWTLSQKLAHRPAKG